MSQLLKCMFSIANSTFIALFMVCFVNPCLGGDYVEVPPPPHSPHHLFTNQDKDEFVSDIQFVFEKGFLWKNLLVLKVCFYGGTEEVNKRVSAIAMQWSRAGKLKLEFSMRDCASSSEQFHIRVAYDLPDGSWSDTGNQAMLRNGNQATMNLYYFHTNPPPEPEFSMVVLHEFGHAIGFAHEFMNPHGGCDSEFDWEVVYERWRKKGKTKTETDKQLRQLPDSSAYGFSEYDNKSVMRYVYPPEYFVKGEDSPCYGAIVKELSNRDKRGIQKAFSVDLE